MHALGGEPDRLSSTKKQMHLLFAPGHMPGSICPQLSLGPALSVRKHQYLSSQMPTCSVIYVEGIGVPSCSA